MEILEINSFLIIKKAKFEVNNLNIIVGPQANGKSILTKLLYFFRNILEQLFIISITNSDTIPSLKTKIKVLFNEIFPLYTWKDTSLNLNYKKNEYHINITKEKKHKSLKIELNNHLQKLYKTKKDEYKKYEKANIEKQKTIEYEIELFLSVLNNTNSYNSYFIPAGRSFFANLQNNIFSLISKDIDIDYFLKIFGSHYEFARKVFDVQKDYNSEIKDIMNKIIKGKYKFKESKDWIKSKSGLINLSDASSGQQEALPMLIILYIFSTFTDSTNSFFIEEPEAHLFPEAQKDIIDLISMIYNKKHNIIMTTHSPYILTAINNLVLANDIKKQKGIESIKDILNPNTCIKFEDVNAYTIKNGILESIVDDKNRLIGENIIDEVSNNFSKVFDNLLELED
jgi:predicted ATPase